MEQYLEVLAGVRKVKVWKCSSDVRKNRNLLYYSNQLTSISFISFILQHIDYGTELNHVLKYLYFYIFNQVHNKTKIVM